MHPVQLQRFGTYRGRVLILLMAPEPLDELRSVGGLQDAEGIEGVLRLEPVWPIFEVLQTFTDLDGLGSQQRGWSPPLAVGSRDGRWGLGL